MKKQIGFTLIEVMVTLVIVAILSAIAAPSISFMLDKNKVRAQTQRVNGLLGLARSTAISDNQAIIFHHDNSSGSLDIDVYSYDGMADGAYAYNSGAGDEYIRQSEGEITNILFGLSGSFDDTYIRFTNQGRLDTGEAIGSMTICNDAKDFGRIIEVNLVGRVTVSESTSPSTECP